MNFEQTMSVKISFKLKKILTHNYFSFPKKLVNIRYVYTYTYPIFIFDKGNLTPNVHLFIACQGI